jgi:hypothetical protein
MSLQSSTWVRSLSVLLFAWACGACDARAVRPSDCQPRNADSTCAGAVARTTDSAYFPSNLLYDGPLGGVPASGYAYWGFDFAAEAAGVPSAISQDMYINRSGVAVTITLTFDYPTTHSCGQGCLAGVKFLAGTNWHSVFPPTAVSNGHMTLSLTVGAGDSYGWVIGLWQATNPWLTVTVPTGTVTTLERVGLSASPALADEVAAIVLICDCPDTTQRACSKGTHFSNGLVGVYYQSMGNYVRAGAFSDCPAQR